MMASFGGVAGGTIRPSRFVKKTEVNGEPVILECGANEDVYGISDPGTRNLALSGWDDGNAAIVGEQILVYGPGDDGARLELGGTVTAGQLIKSGAAGVGVAATADQDRAGARAKIGGVSGDVIPVELLRFDVSIA